MQNNIIPRDKLEKVVSKLSGRIVTTNGAFDLFHVGHLKTLLFAKAQGDILIVGINSDSSIKRYKSEKRPIISQEERAEIVAAIGCVDYVTIFD
ncbi:MAG: adenylyltransferase/cytidyltransferase family protein, partial [Nanoarchaeota archaeon]|nr:adenylyltransferase/cytidyltransferase family protein [Nanoarchaeota archaeon]